MHSAIDRHRDATLIGNMDTSFLKVLALIFMLIDHIGAAILPGVAELRVIGRMAFPLYCWCLVVGSLKTKNPIRYGLRLLVLGIIAQPLYMMALSHSWADLNILFSLLIGLIALVGIQQKWCFSQFWVPALCYLLLGFIKVDYGWMGLTFILVLYGARKNRGGLIAAYLAYALFWGTTSSTVTHFFSIPFVFHEWPGIGRITTAFFRMQGMVWLSLPLIVLPSHTGIKMPKWLGYALYPMHLVVIIGFKIWLLLQHGSSLSVLFNGF